MAFLVLATCFSLLFSASHLFLSTTSAFIPVSEIEQTGSTFVRQGSLLAAVDQLKSDLASSELWHKENCLGSFADVELFSLPKSEKDDYQVEHGILFFEEILEKSHLLVCEVVKGDQNAMPDATEESDLRKTFRWKVVDLKRSLLGDGAHRQLKTIITWHQQRQPSRKTISENQCSVILIERLPNGIIVDEYELHRLRQRGVFQKVYVYGDTNLELSAIHSKQSTVEVHVVTSMLKKMDTLLQQAEVSIPLHSRYSPLSLDTHFLLNISVPDVLLSCSSGQEKVTLYHSTTTPNNVEESMQLVCQESLLFPLRSLQWPVPAGNPVHLDFVSRFTGLAAFLGVIVIFFVSHISSYA
ncbi:hypothetical protein O6H91_19G061500 [Diphasiastrum complanatum]|uniref:Uncharacterized protein n=2 Tax=Diphasiastrum complanatum TaxID=34168 RepID=A0ACC2AVP0_DIPCM|nr:hypothetical protein O6H91_19G061500 [Diphasiastrum complanatum]KAJ7521623.1 hypothetical protein O6H91_19G061500 [Diphasiastrum complanatum]